MRINKNQDKSCDSPSRHTLLEYSFTSLKGINELRAVNTPANGPESQLGTPVDVAAPTGYVVSTISSFIRGKKEIPAPPVIARVIPIKTSLSGYCMALINPNIATIEIPNVIFVTKACRLEQVQKIEFGKCIKMISYELFSLS